MGWRFRRSFTVMPGLRLNVSKSGLSASVGSSPFSVHVGPRGVYANANLPGTGISMRQRIGALGEGAPEAGAPPANSDEGISPEFRAAWERVRASRLLAEAQQRERATTEIRSSSTAGMTSPHLEDLRDVLAVAQREREELTRDVTRARASAKETAATYDSWESGFLLKRLRKGRFAALKSESEEAKDRLAELEEQLRLSSLKTEISLPPSHEEAYRAMTDAFAALATCKRVWDTTYSRGAQKVLERTAADQVIERTPVSLALATSDLIETQWRVPHMGNANGGDLYLYPGLVLYRISREAFAVIDAKGVQIEYAPIRFHEAEQVPLDSEVVGHTWRYVNKNGTPDRRYASNPQIPIAVYGQLTFRSGRGLNERYLVSDAQAAEAFARRWASMFVQ